MNNPVSSPAHYNQGEIEAIQAIEAMVGGFSGPMAYLLGNCLKYIWRHKYKGHPQQDLEKALWYLKRAIEKVNKPPVSVGDTTNSTDVVSTPTYPERSNSVEGFVCGSCAYELEEAASGWEPNFDSCVDPICVYYYE